MSKIYVASSWRNNDQPKVVELLRRLGHEVYDFKNPRPGYVGFKWSEIDPDWINWSFRTYVEALNHPIAIAGYESDLNAMNEANTCVLVLPSGRSAHLEFGWCCGRSKRGVIFSNEDCEPELMAKMADKFCVGWDELEEYFGK